MKCKSQKNWLTHIFTLILVIFPILSLYGTNISTITIGDITLVTLFPFLLLNTINNKYKEKQKIYLPLLMYLIYIIIQFFLLSFNENSGFITDIGARTLRYCVYLLYIIFFLKSCFDFKYGLKVYKYVSIFSTIYLMLQIVLLKTTNYYLSGFVSFLPVKEYLIDHANTILIYGTRPRSIFGEPAHYAQYILGYLALSLFSNKRDNQIKTQIFLTLGLILSASSTGILTGFAIWFVWIVMKLRSRISLRRVAVFVYLAVLVIVIFFSSNQSQSFLRDMENGNSIAGRFDGYNYLKSQLNDSEISLLFGEGMNATEVYYAGFARIIYYFGLMGLMILIISSIVIFLKVPKQQKILLLLLLGLNIGTEILLGQFILVYFPFICLYDTSLKNDRLLNNTLIDRTCEVRST